MIMTAMCRARQRSLRREFELIAKRVKLILGSTTCCSWMLDSLRKYVTRATFLWKPHQTRGQHIDYAKKRI